MSDVITVLVGMILFAAGAVALYRIGREDGRADQVADTPEPPVRLYRSRRHQTGTVCRLEDEPTQPIDPDATAVLPVFEGEWTK